MSIGGSLLIRNDERGDSQVRGPARGAKPRKCLPAERSLDTRRGAHRDFDLGKVLAAKEMAEKTFATSSDIPKRDLALRAFADRGARPTDLWLS